MLPTVSLDHIFEALAQGKMHSTFRKDSPYQLEMHLRAHPDIMSRNLYFMHSSGCHRNRISMLM